MSGCQTMHIDKILITYGDRPINRRWAAINRPLRIRHGFARRLGHFANGIEF